MDTQAECTCVSISEKPKLPKKDNQCVIADRSRLPTQRDPGGRVDGVEPRQGRAVLERASRVGLPGVNARRWRPVPVLSLAWATGPTRGKNPIGAKEVPRIESV